MNRQRRRVKARKPATRWSQRTRPVLVRRKDVSPEEFAALPIQQKYPPRLFKAHDEPFRCGTPMIRAAEFVGPPRPSLEASYRGSYPLTNWKRKRLKNSESHRYFMRRILRDPRYT